MTLKQKLSVLFLVVFLVCTLGAQEIYMAPKAAKVNVDGKLNEWSEVAAITLDHERYLVIPNRAWGGPEDVSGKIYVMWDEEYLYIACDITDNVVLQEKEGSYLFQGDCVEVYLRMDIQKNGLFNYYTTTDFQFGFTPGTDANAPDFHVWNNTTALTDIIVETQKTDKGYTLEMAIPAWEIGIFLEEGWEIGFDVAIDDVDTQGAEDTEIQLCWSMKDTGWQDPTVFQLLILE